MPMIGDIFVPDIAGAFEEGRQMGAKRNAGNALAMGNYGGAKTAMYGAGLIDEGNALAKYGREQADDAATREGLNAFATQDYTGASKAFARGGNLPGVQASLEAQQKALDASQALLDQSVPFLKDALTKHGPDAALEGFNQFIVPRMKVMGMSDADIQQYAQGLQTNPEGLLAALEARVGKKYRYEKVGSDLLIIDERTGEVVKREEGKVRLSEGQSYYDPDSGRVLYSKPKTFAPARASGGGGGWGSGGQTISLPPPP